MENVISHKYTFTAVRESDASISNLAYADEKWFLRSMCEAMAGGFKIIYAAELTIQDESVIGIIRLRKYISE